MVWMRKMLEAHMTRFVIMTAIVASLVGAAYAAGPDLVQACCECCKDMIECCGHKHS